ncbi:DSD1 family PLP-dependent enzyme [Polaromonas sp.]|uniref:DSD1 family PLP-dependent enzyme n=1 Tax=Polaromonas sp. TaxID=1869339 RepID=UPI0017B7D773|nr:DSD1 family PLP-dependent enzyme [Polaromonas sp.]NMM07755.1 DSD1 family PLP-dependent enzyme [Polaromonas sp.]
MNTSDFDAVETPALLLDTARMDRNIERMRARISRHGVCFRPHVKTNKCMEVTQRLLDAGARGITVSTLREAEYFSAQGIHDILYAVCLSPNKLAHALRLRQSGVKLSVIIDNVEMARQLNPQGLTGDARLEVLIEIDSDGHRSGVQPGSAELLAIAQALQSQGLEVAGVMTHAGDSYNCRSLDGIRALAEQERAAAVLAADRLRAAGYGCQVVSVGSTPTALFAENLAGVTEVRAGVFVFFDLVMAGLGVCSIDDIAVSVLATVIGHQQEKGWTLIDAGWMAMSRDRGTSKQALDQVYGVVCSADGLPLQDLLMVDANQEHGIIARRPGSSAGAPPFLPIGSQVRILPNHACATAAQFPCYQTLDGGQQLLATWQRFYGW